MKITITKTSDWEKLNKLDLHTVVDPMVFRCGELFLKGASDALEQDKTKDLLNKNIDSIGSFFDALILNEQLPVFNYGDTFDANLNFDQRILTRINDYDDVMFDIDVEYDPYHKVKDAALSELKKVYEGQHKISENIAHQIIKELLSAEYQWNPDLGVLQNELHSESERNLAAFLLGGLIFSGYAQMMESEHLLQPKRSRLFLAVSLKADSADFELEEHLFEDLKKRANTSCEDLPWFPTFFPYLLSKSDTPKAILNEVVKLRRSSEVVDYRQWLREVMEDWKANGKISHEKKKDVRTIVQQVDRVLGKVSSLPKVEAKATVANVIAGKLPGAIDFTPSLQRLWGWIISSLPGKRYRKLLTRAIASEHEYHRIEKRINTVWNAG